MRAKPASSLGRQRTPLQAPGGELGTGMRDGFGGDVAAGGSEYAAGAAYARGGDGWRSSDG